MTRALARREEALTQDEIVDFIRRRIGDHLLEVTDEYDTLTLVLDAEGYVEAARICFEHDRMAFTMFDCLFGVDAREHGFDVIAILYAPEFGNRVCLRHRCEGGREEPVAPTLTHLWEGANWHEREAWDMFGIEFEGHPGLAPRILCVENFEGWPLRKDFYLASREAKPWPGIKEPAELDEDGNVIVKVPGPGDAPGPMDLDKAMADQAKLANPDAEPETKVLEPETMEGGVDLEEVDEAPSVDAEAQSDDLADKEPGAEAEPEGAEVATDSGQVVAGEKQLVEEDAEKAESDAKVKAEERRKAAAEARARKAAERADAEEPAVSTPEEDVAEVPEGRARSPEAYQGGGAPGTPPPEAPERGMQESDVEGGHTDTVDETARQEGKVDQRPDEAPVQPEGREVEEPDEPSDADDLDQVDEEDTL